MIIKHEHKCRFCGKSITTKGHWYNQFTMKYLNNLQVSVHDARYHRGKQSDILLSIWDLFAASIGQVLIIMLLVTTYPFWVIHEIVKS